MWVVIIFTNICHRNRIQCNCTVTCTWSVAYVWVCTYLDAQRFCHLDTTLTPWNLFAKNILHIFTFPLFLFGVFVCLFFLVVSVSSRSCFERDLSHCGSRAQPAEPLSGTQGSNRICVLCCSMSHVKRVQTVLAFTTVPRWNKVLRVLPNLVCLSLSLLSFLHCYAARFQCFLFDTYIIYV